jgi:hypothetical protein
MPPERNREAMDDDELIAAMAGVVRTARAMAGRPAALDPALGSPGACGVIAWLSPMFREECHER